MKLSACYILIAALFFGISCQNSVNHKGTNSKNTIPGDKESSIYLDSLQITGFLHQYFLSENYNANFKSFYKERNEAFAWINTAGTNNYAKNFINLLSHDETGNINNSLPRLDKLTSLYNSLTKDDSEFNTKDTLYAQLELLLTLNFFDYAKHNWGEVGKEETNKVGWYMDRKKLNYANLLDLFLRSDANAMLSFDPLYRQYGLLKKQLQKYTDIESKGGWAIQTTGAKKLRKGTSSTVVASIKKQLFMTGDLITNDSANLFDVKLEEAVKKFQKRNGLKEDGIIAGKTMQALSIPVHQRIQQILMNMERCKWVPADQKGDYLAVNIPAFKLYVYHNDSLVWSSNVVVGKTKAANNTVVFNDNLEEIVFSPYWNIPKDIVIEETLPQMKKHSNYLESHNMEIVNDEGQPVATSSVRLNKYTTSFPYIIRQKPGKNNALGLVKFLFPNSYDIYMHDTPEKSFFGESSRAFSHGCIRLQEPFKLAKYLLRDDSSYTDEKINDLMHGEKQTYVKLKTKVPVFIAYFTAWVDRDGILNFGDDIYHHDEEMNELLAKT